MTDILRAQKKSVSKTKKKKIHSYSVFEERIKSSDMLGSTDEQMTTIFWIFKNGTGHHKPYREDPCDTLCL